MLHHFNNLEYFLCFFLLYSISILLNASDTSTSDESDCESNDGSSGCPISEPELLER